VDEELWRWIWVGAAAVFGVGEMITAGFFLLPFAVGAVASAVLAFLNVDPAIQGVVFVAVSIAALVWLRRFADRSSEHQPAVGANRFIGEAAVALEPIDRVTGTGRVRMATEQWRATTDGPTIEPGTEVRVIGVRGTRLVVQPLDRPPAGHGSEQEDR
jgi:membrane protein implicated in regulation of membrane protease activity